MAKQRSKTAATDARGVTPERAARLNRLLQLLGTGPQTRGILTRRLRLDVRGFYRDLEVLRAAGIAIALRNRRYFLDEPVNTARAALAISRSPPHPRGSAITGQGANGPASKTERADSSHCCLTWSPAGFAQIPMLSARSVHKDWPASSAKPITDPGCVRVAQPLRCATASQSLQGWQFRTGEQSMMRWNGWLGSLALLVLVAWTRGQRQTAEPPLLQTQATVSAPSVPSFKYDPLGLTREQTSSIPRIPPLPAAPKQKSWSWSLHRWFCCLIEHMFGPDRQTPEPVAIRRRYPDPSTGLGVERPGIWPPAHGFLADRTPDEPSAPEPYVPVFQLAPEIAPPVSDPETPLEEARRGGALPSLLVTASFKERREPAGAAAATSSRQRPWEGPVPLPAPLTVADLRPCPALRTELGGRSALASPVLQVVSSAAPTISSASLSKRLSARRSIPHCWLARRRNRAIPRFGLRLRRSPPSPAAVRPRCCASSGRSRSPYSQCGHYGVGAALAFANTPVKTWIRRPCRRQRRTKRSIRSCNI